MRNASGKWRRKIKNTSDSIAEGNHEEWLRLEAEGTAEYPTVCPK